MVTSWADLVATWAAAEPSLRALVLIGSQVRGAADAASDWDFQVIADDPGRFADENGMHGLIAGAAPRAYCVRPTFGGVQRVTALYPEAEVDLVILPARTLRFARLAVSLGLHRRPGRLRRALADLAVVIRPGYRFLKGEAAWDGFYRKVLADVPDPRLDDAEIRALAAGFVCDAAWIGRKLDRGELLAAQRMLHQSLAETNFRLGHELRLRRGEPSQPEARRLEQAVPPADLAALTITAHPTREALHAAVAQARATLETLLRDLTPDWRWPEQVAALPQPKRIAGRE